MSRKLLTFADKVQGWTMPAGSETAPPPQEMLSTSAGLEATQEKTSQAQGEEGKEALIYVLSAGWDQN